MRRPHGARARVAPQRGWVRRRIRWLAPLAVLVVLSPAIYSYATTMMQPSSLPLWPRSIEWLRAHHGNWLVDTVEHYYYRWEAPDPGGPQLTSLPQVGAGPAAATTARRHRIVQLVPPRIPTPFAHPLPGEGVWHGTGATVGGRPPVLLTTFRPTPAYPR